MFNFVAGDSGHAVIINYDGYAIDVYNRALFCVIQRHDVDIVQLNVLLDVQFGPVGQRENSDIFTFIYPAIEDVP